MRWTVKLSEHAARTIEKLDKPHRDRIRRFLREELSGLDDPRAKGKPLQGGLRGLWRYRVGDYRIVCEIRGHEFVVLVVKIGHRRDVYR
ncbi:type II toxin-antitoxin system RelE family toxin [Candidatus Methylocalor cossyra]|uniref:Type II toxin-antitoxin system RelE/ParE family toxin n=1 Tax=Candidatus Methylocalor cossyra TaxID=3108543 RepID=A0ABM9NMP3_9GAMM